jgi:murein DD-endopeptidase MepM/ murein hydrolase activator NlpD
MMYLSGFGRCGCFGLKTPRVSVIVLAAAAGVLTAGCSADVARFDSSSFALNDPPEASSPPVPPENVRGNGASDFENPVARSTPRGPYGAGASSVEVAALPEAAGSPPQTYTPQPYKPAAARAPVQPMPLAKGEAIAVQPGDTLYGLSKRHQVSVAELMSVNGLTSPNLKPGQKLNLPGSGAAVAGNYAAAPKPVQTAAALPPPSADVSAKYAGTYMVKPGESLYGIARTYKVPFTELQQVNQIADARKVKPGTVIKVPGVAPLAAAEALPQATTAAAPAPRVTQPSAPSFGQSTAAQPTVINANKQVAALGDKSSNDAAPIPPSSPAAKGDRVAVAAPAAAEQAVDSVKLRWPAQGKVIGAFGGRPDGTHNDGINLSVPLGTDVHAAESGVVAYAGSELKGYGNLVLIRHDNGWVTAYAHNDELLVKRGDKIKRGQVIGKAGKTGTVDQPQVHFELRQGSKPVDPTPFMEKL